MIKSLFRCPYVWSLAFVQSLIHLCGLNWVAPDYTTICRRQQRIDTTIGYQKVVMDYIYLSTLLA